MKPTTADNLAHLVTELDLAPQAAVHQAVRESGGDANDVEAFGQGLVRRELLTSFQLERLLRGERQGYFFGRAKLLYQIGAGAFARVYRAIHRDTGAILAVKVLRKRFAADAEKRAAFQREGEMGRLLRHPHIVAIEDVGVEHGAAYLVMEFIEGGTLREVVKIRGALDPARGLELVMQLLAGLEYAHRRGVAHRDLKASNVLVAASGVAKLVDFGLARVDETGDKALGRSAQPRTLDYAALEKLTGMKDDDMRSYVYLIVTLAYLVFAGQPALADSRDRSVRSDPTRYTRVQPLATVKPDVPRDVCDFVARMMQLDPLERFQNAGDARRGAELLAERLRGGGGGPVAAAVPVAPVAPGKTTLGTVMLVEAGEPQQQALREVVAKLGDRVLITENPQRALSRFSSRPRPADCLVISAKSLGGTAVAAFNALVADSFMADVPAILLVDPRQHDVLAAAKPDGKRRVVPLPLQSADLARTLTELMAAKPSA